jgi:hypothetical protein
MDGNADEGPSEPTWQPALEFVGRHRLPSGFEGLAWPGREGRKAGRWGGRG